LKVNYTGCAICDSSWGDLWEEVEGTRLFFCCPVCLRQFRELLERLRAGAGWDSVDELEIAGDRRRRTVRARRGTEELRAEFAFYPDGRLRLFEPRAARPA
jgi:hypothetical protein